MRTLHALELLAERPRTRAEIAEALEVHPRTARRLIDALAGQGYVEPSGADGREYTVTPKLVTLARISLTRSEPARVAAEYLARLRDLTGETVAFAQPGDHGAILVAVDLSDAIVAAWPTVGSIAAYHASALGKALLAHISPVLDRTLQAELSSLTLHTLADPGDLIVELAEIRSRGFATDDLESSIDLRSVASPVFDGTRAAIASLGVVAPSSRLQPDQLQAVGETVKRIAGELSMALGYVVPVT